MTENIKEFYILVAPTVCGLYAAALSIFLLVLSLASSLHRGFIGKFFLTSSTFKRLSLITLILTSLCIVGLLILDSDPWVDGSYLFLCLFLLIVWVKLFWEQIHFGVKMIDPGTQTLALLEMVDADYWTEIKKVWEKAHTDGDGSWRGYTFGYDFPKREKDDYLRIAFDLYAKDLSENRVEEAQSRLSSFYQFFKSHTIIAGTQEQSFQSIFEQLIPRILYVAVNTKNRMAFFQILTELHRLYEWLLDLRSDEGRVTLLPSNFANVLRDFTREDIPRIQEKSFVEIYIRFYGKLMQKAFLKGNSEYILYTYLVGAIYNCNKEKNFAAAEEIVEQIFHYFRLFVDKRATKVPSTVAGDFLQAFTEMIYVSRESKHKSYIDRDHWVWMLFRLKAEMKNFNPDTYDRVKNWLANEVSIHRGLISNDDFQGLMNYSEREA